MNLRGVRKKRYLLLVYAALLVASHAVRHARDVPRPGDFSIAHLQVVRGSNLESGRVYMAYKDFASASGDAATPVLIVHGSPIKSFDLTPLARLLAEHRRVLLPDLPGLGRSQRFVPDYSMEAHGRYLAQWLDQLGVQKIHVVAYSQGGGPALWLTSLRPSQVASLTLLSSIGVQELELLGNYDLNHALHGVQWIFFWLLTEGTPHFGWLDGFILNERYARNFYDSDQRPLRGFLQAYAGPALIMHAREDVLVPPAAAQEHHRILPQSELVWMRGGHGTALFEPERVATGLEAFLELADAGGAVTRAQADPARVKRAAERFGTERVEPAAGLALVIVMALIVVGTFVSEDLACIGAGLMAAHGSVAYAAAALAAFIGIFAGDLLLFLAGKYIGRPALRHRPLRWLVKEADIEESAAWFHDRGPWVIVLSRFVPGSRLPTYFAAGMLHTSLLKFLGFFFLAGAVWAPLLVWLAKVVGGPLMGWLHAYKTLTMLSVLAVAILLWIVVELIVPLFSFKGRRLLVSSWRRKTRWEFWPLWVFYPPVVLYVFALAVRHRGLSVFTACNPAIPGGGFLGESKHQILRGLQGSVSSVAPWELVPAGVDALTHVRAFMARHGLSYPVVLKPDVGQRGLGVAIARSEEDVTRYFARARGATLVQEYIPGLEFGIFYYRYPDETDGHILAVTDKRFPEVVGDGVQTLEHLILQDDRAVCMAHFFLRQWKAELFRVPAAGERVRLVELGTHCRGSVFLDGTHLVTPALAQRVDAISKTFPGFHFGRYDVRVPSVEDFQAGRNLRVIELNGVTAEATAIYQPGNSILAGYRLLMKQWRIAFEIGAAFRARGVKPTPVRELARVLLDYESGPEA